MTTLAPSMPSILNSLITKDPLDAPPKDVQHWTPSQVPRFDPYPPGPVEGGRLRAACPRSPPLTIVLMKFHPPSTDPALVPGVDIQI